MTSCAIFLDRDGTIIREAHYLHRPEEVELLPGAGPALGRLAQAGYRLFIVTNQSGVGRGYFSMADVEAVNAHLVGLLAPHGVQFDRIYVAPEAPDQPSRGRKPSPQFLLDAREEFGLNLAACYMVGDKRVDLECGWNAGVRACLLVRTGYGAEAELNEPSLQSQAVVVDDLGAAADYILRTNRV